MVSSLPPLIVCRFILRQVKPAGSSWVSGNQSHSLRFVGNMGETLQFGEENDNDNEIEEDVLSPGPEVSELYELTNNATGLRAHENDGEGAA